MTFTDKLKAFPTYAAKVVAGAVALIASNLFDSFIVDLQTQLEVLVDLVVSGLAVYWTPNDPHA